MRCSYVEPAPAQRGSMRCSYAEPAPTQQGAMQWRVEVHLTVEVHLALAVQQKSDAAATAGTNSQRQHSKPERSRLGGHKQPAAAQQAWTQPPRRAQTASGSATSLDAAATAGTNSQRQRNKSGRSRHGGHKQPTVAQQSTKSA